MTDDAYLPQELVAMYQRDFGFDFSPFMPAELFHRIQGAPSAAADQPSSQW